MFISGGFVLCRFLHCPAESIMRYFSTIFLFLLIGNVVSVDAQNLVQDTLQVKINGLYQLRPFIERNSFTLFSGQRSLDTTWYRLDVKTGLLRLLKELDSTQPLVARYRAFPLDFRQTYYRYLPPNFKPDTTLLRDLSAYRPPPPKNYNPFEGSALQRSGSITRGIIAGNRRDVTIASGFKMQLNGEIAPGIQLNASLTDENTPIQPEGTTQRISDVDRIVIGLSSKSASLNLGDFDLTMNQGQFARINRKLQGVSVKSTFQPSSTLVGEQNVRISAATSRGIYHSMQFNGQEGVQGPYRLYGKQGESFIIVIAGSERVYMDGQLLARGESLDYVIDYASGEIMFSTRIMITSVKRIQVEFEYTTNRFSRSLVGAHATSAFFKDRHAPSGRISFGVNALREADAIAFTEELNVSDLELEVLKNAGDNPLAAAVSGATLVQFDPKASYTHYVKRDTVIAGIHQTFYRVIRNLAESSEVYRVRFTQVEQGKGSYIRIGEVANGITFRFVGPTKGNYEPQRFLPTPQEKALVTMNSQVLVLPGLELNGEWALSQQDLNRLSQINDNNNSSQALQFGLNLKPVALGAWRLSGKGQYRHTGSGFEAFDRIRDIEFARQWNLSESATGVGSGMKGFAEKSREFEVGVSHATKSSLSVSGGSISYPGSFEANRLAGQLKTAHPKWLQTLYLIEKIDSKDNANRNQSDWLRQKGTLRSSVDKTPIQGILSFEHEQKMIYNSLVLQKGSFSFIDLRPEVFLNGSKTSGQMGFEYRREKKVLDQSLIPENQALTARAAFSLKPISWMNGETEMGFRRKRYTEEMKLKAEAKDASSLLIKGNLRASPWKRTLEVQGFYEATTEKSPILQEIFREVLPGEGTFVWVDVNKDGLRQVDEFLPALSQIEGNYVRLLVPSDELKPVANVEARLRISFVPQRIWAQSTHRLAKIIRIIETQTIADVVEKTEETSLGKVYRLAPEVLRQPEKTINGRIRFSQDVHLWRNHPTYGASLQFLRLTNLSRLAAGVENRFQERWNIETRYNPSVVFKIRIIGLLEHNQQESKTFLSRNYNIYSQNVHLEVQFQPNVRNMFSLGVLFAQKEDRFANPAKAANVVRIPANIRLARAGKLQWSGLVEFASIRLKGSADGLAGYELTDGRGAGTNWLWSSQVQYSFNRLLRASIFYDGRTATASPTLHNFRAQVNATF